MKTTKTTLQQETEAYWLISSTWNDRVDVGIKTDEGLKRLSVGLSRTGPKRALRRHLDDLLAEIINPRLSKKNKQPALQIPLKKVEAQ